MQLDDFVYVRREWQITCCQLDNPKPIQKLTFDDLRQGKPIPGSYKGVKITPKAEVLISSAPENSPSKPNSLYKKASANPLVLSSLKPFNLLSLTLTIQQYSPPPFTSKLTRIILTGHDAQGGELGRWEVFAATYQGGTYSINLGGDWQIGNTGGLYINGRTGGGGQSGFFSSGGFRKLNDVRIQVTVEDHSGNGGQSISSVPQSFWIDDFEFQSIAGCESDF
jgi:hypothetical protein